MKFITQNSSHFTLYIGYKEKYIEETNNTEYLGPEIDNHIKWRNHIKQGIYKLSGAGYAVRSGVHVGNVHFQMNLNTCFHSVTKYGIILGGNSSYSLKYFTLQMKIVRIMAGAQPRTSCRSLFNQPRDSACSIPLYTLNNELHYL